MPATTTAINASQFTVYLQKGDDGNDMADISGSGNGLNPSFVNKTGEFEVFGGNWVYRLASNKDATISLQVVYTTAAEEGFAVLKDWYENHPRQARRMRWFAPTEEVGADDYDGYFLLSGFSYNADPSQAGPVLVTATLQHARGGVTIGTAAT